MATNTPNPNTSAQSTQEVLQTPPLTIEEEDALIHTRITNDERPLRRATKKFHIYTSVAYPPIVSPPPSTTSSVEEAREAFLVELANFHLLLKKSALVCEAESRQVEEYKISREAIARERGDLREQIEQLKVDLENAQLERRRKIEYDQVAEKINTLPSRDELELSISALENDLQAIRSESETQDRVLQARKHALDAIVSDLGHLRVLGKEEDASVAAWPAPDVDATMSQALVDDSNHASAKDDPVRDAGSDTFLETDKDNDGKESSGEPASTSLNPTAKTFQPHEARTSSPLLLTATHQLRLVNANGKATASRSNSQALTAPSSPTPTSKGGDSKKEDGEEDEDDIEMGEVSEGKGKSRKREERVEDREEGEASDESSELSEPPDE